MKQANKNALKNIFKSLGLILIYSIQILVNLFLYLPRRVLSWIGREPLLALVWGFVIAIFSFIFWAFGGFMIDLFNAYLSIWAVDPFWGVAYTIIAIVLFGLLSTATWIIFF